MADRRMTVSFHQLGADGRPDPTREPVNFNPYSFTFNLTNGQTITYEEPLMEATEIPARPTKAAMEELAEQRDNARRLLARREADLAAAKQETEEWKAVKVADAEAEALSGCVRAIEGLLHSQTSGRQTGGYGMAMSSSYTPAASSSPIGRILLHLAARYGIALAEPTAPTVDSEDPVMLSVPRRVADQLVDSGTAYRV